jgi:riboflavin kinase/FMN adenylyltransferase
MEIVRKVSALQRDAPYVATIGKFDGMHLGHQYLISLTKQKAAELGARSMVITFDPHPLLVLRPGLPFQQLTCLSDKIKMIGALGVDLLLIITFTPQVVAQSPLEFMESLTRHINLRMLVEGEDFALGKGRAGTPAVLAEIGAHLGYEVETVTRLRVGRDEVSSNTIRHYLDQGDVAAAARLLGRAPSASGPVVEGAKRGRLIGVPTANLLVEEALALPANGVYAAVVTTPELAQPYRAMVNIGTRPTFDDGKRTVEAHLLGFEGDLYGMMLTAHFVARLRAEQRFDGVEALVAQLQRDRVATEHLLTDAVVTAVTRPVPRFHVAGG